MIRYFIYLKFDGSPFHGWQIQPNANSVQSELQEALSKMEQKPIDVVAAGRTDTGVHAQEMVVHFDSEKDWEKRSFIHRLNSLLCKEIAAYDLRLVKNEMHARFAATERSYVYQVSFQKDPFLVNQAYQFHGELDIDKMNMAAQHLIGEFDFSCFSKSNTQTFTNNCDIKKAVWLEKNGIFQFHITANRFLRNMVRAIVGTLVEVGEGKREINSIPDLIDSKNRSNAGPSVPAAGLFLNSIVYPKDGFI
jgi:tRNA pseudouridine38-40 synthase